MSGYGYNYGDEGAHGGQYHDEMNYQYGYHDVGGYGDYGYGEPTDDDLNGMNMGMNMIPGQDVEGGVGIGVHGDEPDGGSSVGVSDAVEDEIDFDDPRIANLPRILLMGPRRAGKTSIQRVVFHKMSPHETLFRLEATQNLERSVVDHTPLCRFTIWDFPGDYYGPEHLNDGMNQPHVNLNAQQQQGMDHLPSISMLRQPPVHGGSPHNEYVGLGNALSNNTGMPLPNTVITGTDPNIVNNNNGHNNSSQDDGDAQVFGQATALIFVLDAQDEPYDHVLQHFTETVKRAAQANPHIAIEVFINKVDGELFLSDEAKYDCRRDVMQQVTDELADAGVMPDSVQISYHLTSIYDHSVFEAFSRVVQKLIPQLPMLENLLNVLVSRCAMEKAYLFDVASKLYISTDSSPVDMQSVELCSDMIDVVLDVSGIYGLPGGGNEEDNSGDGDDGANGVESNGQNGLERSGLVGDSIEGVGANGDMGSSESGSKKLDGGAENGNGNVNDGMNTIDDFTNGSGTALDYGDGNDELVGTLISQGANGDGLLEDDGVEKEADIEDIDGDADTAYDSESTSVIRLSKGMVLYLKEVDTMLALVCLTRSDNFRKRNLINYNIGRLKKALRALVDPSTSE